MTQQKILVGSRASKLALVQTHEVIQRLQAIDPTLDFEVVPIKTKGDLKPNTALVQLGSNGLFVREVETELLNQQIDFAVHSAKDLPAKLAPGLTIAATPPRALAQDVLVVKDSHLKHWQDLPQGAVIGTGSPRRQTLLQHLRPDFKVKNIRGNVPTRLKKLAMQDFDGIVLAAAGLQRLGLLDPDQLHYFDLPTHQFVPAACQGTLALECATQNQAIVKLLQGINDAKNYQTMRCERAFLKTLDGDCTIPLGCLAAASEDGQIQARAFLADKFKPARFTYVSGASADPEKLGITLAQNAMRQLQKKD
ncbi:MAG: hydroxymethylbilane synthase [Lactobacillus sp.]|nr:hydroxymethylbilane synthase [Lactobacillus sp.]